METIGQLTGGVAHDFNNLLTVILGSVDTIKLCLDNPSYASMSRLRRATDLVMRGAENAAALTSRLLAFSRRQPPDPRSTDANRLILNMSDLLHRTLAENIVIEKIMGAGLWLTYADPHQIENALLNLAVNARDAMPDGGRLTIETDNAVLSEAYARAISEVTPGEYVLIAVTDSGIGMSSELMARVFEPFFTTKDVGQRTGLGLSQVYGFVQQSGGHVRICSEVGKGTTVRIYLPRMICSHEDSRGQVRQSELPNVLRAVDSNDDVRAQSVASLLDLGY